MKISLKNSKTDEVKTTKVGFSWTTFFFGFFPAVFREDWRWAAIIFMLEMILYVLTLGYGFWIMGIIFAFFYNRIYINELLKKGFEPTDDSSMSALKHRNFQITVNNN